MSQRINGPDEADDFGEFQTGRARLDALPSEVYVRYNAGPVFVSLDVGYPLINALDDSLEDTADDLADEFGGTGTDISRANPFLDPRLKKIEPDPLIVTVTVGINL